MTRRAWLARAILAANSLLVISSLAAQSAPPDGRSSTMRSILDHNFPRLVLVLTFDQVRYDMLTRYSDKFLPAYGSGGEIGGFRWLMETGAVMADSHYNHVPLHTGPGHATILTGAPPRKTGIIANSWYTSSGLSINCVGDPNERTIGGTSTAIKKGSASPRNLLADTVGDELKLANNNQSKVFGLAVKDRGAILPAGHNADAAVWMDVSQGRWVTSTYYTSGTLPTFAQRANDSKIADQWIGKEWDYLLPEEAYKISMPENSPGAAEINGFDSSFPKRLSEPGAAPDKLYYNQLCTSPFANELVLQTARMAVEYEQLGQDLYPDILAVGFSTPDKMGHAFGPHSRELQDCMLRADRQVSSFFNYLNGAIPGGLDNVLIVLTADHGAAALPEWINAHKMNAGRTHYDSVIGAAEAALAEKWPDKQTTGIVLYTDPNITFRKPVAAKQGINIEKAAEVVAEKLRDLKGINNAFTRKQIVNGNLPLIKEALAVTNGFNLERSGDVVVISDPFHFSTRYPTGSTHGNVYNYDTHVPMIFAGSKIRTGVYTKPVDQRDIAPTLSFLLGILAPASSEGQILSDIIK